jgi:hypothetical protein
MDHIAIQKHVLSQSNNHLFVDATEEEISQLQFESDKIAVIGVAAKWRSKL